MKKQDLAVKLLLILAISTVIVGCGKEETVETETSVESSTEVVETTVAEQNEWDSLEISTLYNTYYRQLAQLEKDVYKQMLYSIENGISEITLCKGLDLKGVDNAYKALEYDNPQLFWLTGNYTYGDGVISVEFNSLAEDLEGNKTKFNAKVDELMESLYFPYKAKDYIKERLVHDKLVSIVSYSEETDFNYNAYGALIDGKASCGGYSKAFQLLMQKSEVPCYYSVGRIYQGGTTTDHAWNVVRLGDNHYNVDITLNDTALDKFGAVSYEFYNLSDSELKDTHVKNSTSLGLPAVTGEEFGYAELYGESCGLASIETLGIKDADIIDNFEEFTDYMVNTINEKGLGEYTFKFIVTNKGLNNEVHYALGLNTQLSDWLAKVNEINKKGWNQIAIESESFHLGDDHYLVEVKNKVEYIEPVVEETEEEKKQSAGGSW